MDEEQEHKERPRPRVVDKRVSARPASEQDDSRRAPPQAPGAALSEQDTSRRAPPQASDTAPTRAEPEAQDKVTQAVLGAEDRARSDVSAQEAEDRAGSATSPQEVWTPQQEEEMRRVAQQIAETPSLDWVANTAITLANVAGTKLDLGATADAQLAIDALAALVNGLGPRLAEAETPLRQTLAQLQMAYAERVAPPPGAHPS